VSSSSAASTAAGTAELAAVILIEQPNGTDCSSGGCLGQATKSMQPALFASSHAHLVARVLWHKWTFLTLCTPMKRPPASTQQAQRNRHSATGTAKQQAQRLRRPGLKVVCNEGKSTQKKHHKKDLNPCSCCRTHRHCSNCTVIDGAQQAHCRRPGLRVA